MPRGIPNSSPSPALSTDSRRLWVVLIGVNEYQDRTFPTLRYSVQDCLGLEEALKLVTVERFAEREFLVHNQPTLNAVCGSLERIAHEARPQDIVLIYFSGHGALIDQDLCFCLTDTQQEHLAATGLPLERLLHYLEKCPASQQLLWSDACFSGGLPSSSADTNPSTLFRDVLQTRARQNQGFYALLSCTASQRAWEFSGLKNGVFTYFLIQGLRGGAANGKRLVEVDQLYTYVSLQTERFINDINAKRKMINDQNSGCGEKYLETYPMQTPYRIVGGAGRLVLGLCPEPQAVTVHVQRQALVIHELVNHATNISFCRSLCECCDFHLSYWQEQNRFLTEEENTRKNTQNLERSIEKLLNSSASATVLLYFRGEVRQKGADTWLMCSNTVGVKRTWLRNALNQARAAYCILILDCRGAKNIYELMAYEEKKNFCILASENHDLFPQVLTQSLSEADPKLGLSLPAWIVGMEKRLKQEQHRLYRWIGGEEPRLMIAPEEHAPPLNRDLNLCPYLGLKTFSEAEVSYFCGRDDITDQLVGRLENNAFLAVVGASGSGKSSVVQAGLIPKLRQGALKDSQHWKILTIRPGSTPLETLALALSDSKPSFELIKEKLEAGAEAFLEYLDNRKEPCLFLIIDQFEELLTLASQEESTRFLDLLLEMLEKGNQKNFRIVITLRSDFYVSDQLPVELNRKIIQSNITLIPMDTISYRAAIEEPAKRVGLKVERNLVTQLLEDLKGSAGDLPLLAFVLQELWTKRQNGHLTLADYQQMQGIQGTLSRRANDIYNRMNPEQQDCLRWILISLTKLGENGALDSRQRIPKSRLFVKNYHSTCIEETLQKLISEKLVVVDFGSEKQVVIEVAHEVLIRKWDKLEGWLNKSREQIQVLRNFQTEAEKWQKEDEREEYLLRGSQLEKIETAPPEVTNNLSEAEQRFLQACQDNRAEIQRQANRRMRIAQGVTVIVSGLLVITGFLAYVATKRTQEVQQEQINLLNSTALSEMEKHPLDALMSSMKAARLLKRTSGASSELVDKTTSTLRYVLGMNQEVNRLEGHTDMVQTIAFSPDGNFLVSGGRDNIVKVWSKEGKLLKTLTGHQGFVSEVAFSSDGQWFATASRDGTIKFWDLGGNCLRTFVAHSLGVVSFTFSPTRQQLVSSGRDGTIKFWDYQGRLLKTVKAHKSMIWKIVFSPDGTLLASASADGSIKFWTPNGKFLKTLTGHKGIVTTLTFSPDSKQIVSSGADKTLRFWSREGKPLHPPQVFEKDVVSPQFTSDGRYLIFSADNSGDIRVRNLGTGLENIMSGHTAYVRSLIVSPDNRYLVSASEDHTIHTWNVHSNFQMMAKNENPKNLAFSKQNNRIAIGSYEGKVSLYTPFQDLKVSLEAHSSPVKDLVFSPDGKFLATLGFEEIFKLWNMQGQLLASWPLSVQSINFTPDSQNIVIGTSGGLVQFLSQEGKLLSSFDTYQGSIVQVMISSDAQKILTIGSNGSVKLWNAQKRLVKTISKSGGSIRYTNFSPNSQLIATINADKNLEILDSQGELILQLPIHKQIVEFRFSLDSKFVGVLNGDHFLEIWNTKGERISTLGRLPSNFLEFDFSPDGKKLITLGPSNSFLFWDWNTNLDSLLKQSCTELHDYLGNNITLTNEQREVCQSL
jgi:WD40 repeat protein/uncharacterized caspase-like protein/energy-coupling factor transporter ATP-binding protein EcfA2